MLRPAFDHGIENNIVYIVYGSRWCRGPLAKSTLAVSHLARYTLFNRIRSPLDETACGDLAISRLIRDRVLRNNA